MAHIVYRPSPDGAPAMQLIINGIDFSMDVYAEGVEIVDMAKYEGDPQTIGLRVTFALDSAEFGGEASPPDSGLSAAIAETGRLCEAIREAADRHAELIVRGINGAASRGKRNGRRGA